MCIIVEIYSAPNFKISILIKFILSTRRHLYSIQKLLSVDEPLVWYHNSRKAAQWEMILWLCGGNGAWYETKYTCSTIDDTS